MPLRGQADVNVSEKMFDRYNCMKSFCHLKSLEKRLRKVQFCITIMARKSIKDS